MFFLFVGTKLKEQKNRREMQTLHLFCADESEFVIKIEVQVKMNYYFIRKFTVMHAVCHAVNLGMVLKNFVLNLGLVQGLLLGQLP